MRKLNISNLKKLSGVIKDFSVDHAPELLTGIGLATIGVGVVLTGKATIKATRRVEDMIYENGGDLPTKKEIVKECWKDYIGAGITIATGTAAIIGGATVGRKRNVALATACEIALKGAEKYQDKVVEVIGEKKEKTIHDEVAKEALENANLDPNLILDTGHGDTLIYDMVSGIPFKSDIDFIKSKRNDFNYRLQSEMWMSWNEWFYELGLRPTKSGNELGYNIDRGLLTVKFSAQIINNTPWVVIDYAVPTVRFGYGDM